MLCSSIFFASVFSWTFASTFFYKPSDHGFYSLKRRNWFFEKVKCFLRTDSEDFYMRILLLGFLYAHSFAKPRQSANSLKAAGDSGTRLRGLKRCPLLTDYEFSSQHTVYTKTSAEWRGEFLSGQDVTFSFEDVIFDFQYHGRIQRSFWGLELE